MSDAWEEIQAVKSKRNSLREKLEKRKKERQSILGATLAAAGAGSTSERQDGSPGGAKAERALSSPGSQKDATSNEKLKLPIPPASLEVRLLQILSDMQLQLPATASALMPGLGDVDAGIVTSLLRKFATQKLIIVKDSSELVADANIEVLSAESVRLAAVLTAVMDEELNSADSKQKVDMIGESGPAAKIMKTKSQDTKTDGKNAKKEDTDIMSLLAMPSSREKAVKRVGEEIMDLLSKPTAKERSLADQFKSQGGAQVMEFCPHGTRLECARAHSAHKPLDVRARSSCKKLHFKKIIQSHTDESLGDCSFLNTCFHMDSCKYVHYEVDNADPNVTKAPEVTIKNSQNGSNAAPKPASSVLTLTAPQWIQCDLRFLDMTFLGKFAVIMADPPWDIHMELPYGTMSDDEMRCLGVPQLQDSGLIFLWVTGSNKFAVIMADPPWDIHMELPYGTMSDDEMRCLGVPQLQDSGLIFLWVTGRAMELGRECLKLWGYTRVDELIWVKTNQLQRIIRTGRTGHWLNHGKEHCLVGMKGNPENLNRGLDCDVIVAEVRATSHKPDEIYGIIERLSPGTRKIELFGRPHNVQPNWITLGNQVDGIRLVDPELVSAFRKRYPNGNCMAPPPPDPGLA